MISSQLFARSELSGPGSAAPDQHSFEVSPGEFPGIIKFPVSAKAGEDCGP